MPLSRHTWHACEEERCPVCSGGLSKCEVCGGAEATLTTECPGRKMTAEEQDAVQAGLLDYKNGEWTT